LFFFLAASSLPLPGKLLAGARQDEARIREARVRCAVGEYQAGVKILAEIFVRTTDPGLVYNQGRCYEQNGKADQAILRFEEFLRISPGLPKAEVDEVRTRIEGLRASIGQGKPVVQPPQSVGTQVPAQTVERASPPASSSAAEAEPVPNQSGALVTQPNSIAPAASLPVATPARAEVQTPGLMVQQQLEPAPPSRSILKAWWLWTGIGAVVVGTVVTVLVLRSQSSPQSPQCRPGIPCVP
jgi:hypothetical protein